MIKTRKDEKISICWCCEHSNANECPFFEIPQETPPSGISKDSEGTIIKCPNYCKNEKYCRPEFHVNDFTKMFGINQRTFFRHRQYFLNKMLTYYPKFYYKNKLYEVINETNNIF